MPNRGGQRDAALQEAQILVRLLAAPERSSEPVKTMIARVALRLVWSETRVRHIWHGEARHIESFEMDELRAAVRQDKARR